MEISSFLPSFLAWGAAGLTLYTIYGVTYRLLLSPISSFPGPKLAALTFWYEFYFDIILGGQYIWKIRSMHEQYGPVIRINPYELHINDPEFYDSIYLNDRGASKWHWATRGFGLPNSILQTDDPKTHRVRRNAMNPYFSMQKVIQMQPVVRARIDALMGRLRSFTDSGRVLKLDHMFGALANDVVMEYSFGRHDSKLEAPDFDPNWFTANHGAAATLPTLRHLFFILRIIEMLPESWAAKIDLAIADGLNHRNGFFKQVDAIRLGKEATSKYTVFHAILDSKLPKDEKTSKRMTAEAETLIGAGTETTSWALSVATFYLLTNPTILQKLKDELAAADPTRKLNLSLPALQSLPYLTACINEALRLSYGVTQRGQRIYPTPLSYTPSHLVPKVLAKPYTIPAGVPISQSSVFINQNPDIFPDPKEFRPERWIEDPGLASKYQVAFVKGARRCLGMNLAMSELFTCLAALFLSFGSEGARVEGDVGVLELVGTVVSDLEMYGDCFIPVTKLGSLGIRALLMKRREIWSISVMKVIEDLKIRPQ